MAHAGLAVAGQDESEAHARGTEVGKGDAVHPAEAHDAHGGQDRTNEYAVDLLVAATTSSAAARPVLEHHAAAAFVATSSPSE